MSHELITVLLGMCGGMVPGGVRVAWKIRRGRKSSSGTLDLTRYKTRM